MDINLTIGRNRLKLDTTTLLVGLLMLCVLLTGFVPQLILDILILALSFALLVKGELYLAFPFMIFYYKYFGLVLGVSTYRLFTFLVLFDGMYKLIKQPVITVRYLLPLLVYGLYLAFVMGSIDPRKAVFSFVDVVSCIAMVSFYLMEDVQCIRKFFYVYALLTIAAFITGVVNDNVLLQENSWEDISITRFNATFEDPNYMGFFYTIAVFAIVSLKLFKSKIRWIFVVALYVMLLASVSMTAIVVNAILWLVYLVISNKINIKSFVAGFLVVLLFIGIYQYGLKHPDTPILGDLSYRISDKTQAAETGDMNTATTNRLKLAEEHWQYFLDQPLGKKLFGGTPVNASVIDDDLKLAAHNEYVDMLLNVGILGAVILLGFMFKRTYDCFRAYKETKQNEYLCLLMCKGVWLTYAASLTLFIEWRFMLPFFI